MKKFIIMMLLAASFLVGGVWAYSSNLTSVDVALADSAGSSG